MEINVADISRWQGAINWDAFKDQIQGVVIKAGGADGGLYTDSLFTRNRDEARRVGLPRWFYFYKGAGSARQQAEYFVGIVGALQDGEALVLDDENEARVNVGFAAEFADRVKELTGLNIVLYSNQARYAGVDLTPLKDRNIGAWVAKYGQNTGTVEGAGAAPSIPIMTIIMWQYTSAARVAGVTANTVDMNKFYGGVDQFKAYGAKGNIPAPLPAPSTPPSPTNNTGYYTVVKNDTLSGIGAKLGLNWQDIASWNGIVAPYTIYPNQQLKVFGGAAGNSAPTGATYRVVSGDTLIGIGTKTGRNWQDIAKLNGISAPYTIYPNQTLKLDGAGGTVVAPPAAKQPTYTVVSGDYLVRIQEKTGVNWQTIAKLNGIAPPYTIYPNQVLKLA